MATKRRVLVVPIIPVSPPAPATPPKLVGAPIRRRPLGQKADPQEIKKALLRAAPAATGINTEGSDYKSTIARYVRKIKNPMTAIRAHCVGCSGGSLAEVAQCRVTQCALHKFRMGKNPFRKRGPTDTGAGAAGALDTEDGEDPQDDCDAE